MSMRVHELAKEVGVTSKQLLEELAKLKVAVKGHMSLLEDDVVARITRAHKPKVGAAVKTRATPIPKLATPAATPKAASTKAKPTPAIAPVRKAPSLATPAPARIERPIKPAALPSATAVIAKPAPAKPSPPAAPKPAAPVAPKPIAPPVTPKPATPALAVAAPAAEAPAVVAVVRAPLQLKFPVSVKDLAEKMEVKATDLIKHLMGTGFFASLTQALDRRVATQLAKDFGFELAPQPTLEEEVLEELKPDPAKLVFRAPVVTFMGHVDHGKTSLLDAIRQSKVAEKEAGGITQHIGAYAVVLEKGRVTFLDTPGHEAFTALRARGANVTDIVVLVVAADDGVMPQTIEAIDHAKAADVLIVVAINKMDRPDANPQKVKQQLTEHGLIAEDWGGKTIMVPVSARTGQGIDQLLEMLLLEAELLELRADPTKAAQGVVIEAKQTKDRGPITTLLVQQGTLHVGDLLVVGTISGRVRAMVNDRGHRVKDALPAMPVEVLGLPSVPKAGDRFLVIKEDKLARQLIERRQEASPDRAVIIPRRITLDDLHQRITQGQLKELKLVLKADVQGSLEAIAQSLAKIESNEVKLHIIHMGVGDISESDVMLAAASDAVVIGFHVGMDPRVQVAAVTEGVDVRIYQIIYDLINSIRAALEGLLEPRIEETFLGRAEVKRLFQVSKVGIVAGCMVTKGTIRRDATIRVIRGKERLMETKAANLKRVKDDVREVQEGVECGISLEGNADLQPGDLIEAWELKKVARKLA